VEQISDIEGEVLKNEPVVPGYFRLSIRPSKPMPAVRAGQFVMIRVPSTEVFLRRPFSIYDVRGGVVTILYKVVGRGTTELSRVGRKDRVMVLGPLGNGFTLLPGHEPVLVGGGIGIAGLHLAWQRLKGKGAEKGARLFWGCTSDAEIGLIDKIISCEPHVCTIDGSYGCRGNVVEMLAQELPRMKKPIQVLACGPEAMFVSLKGLLEKERTPCQVLLEERMACGLGICFGCVKKTHDEAEPYKRVCKEGPVFDLWQISL
jgi:dihydroorotate dehydrogenase electron transfer subunit